MNRAQESLSQSWQHIQGFLFPMIEEEIGRLSTKQQLLINVLEFAELEKHLPYFAGCVGRPPEDRCAIARAFVAKMVYNMPTTRMLLDRLECDIQLRRICGWETIYQIPSESTFSRAFAEFAETQLPTKVHNGIIQDHYSDQVVGHVSRDSTQIEAREKPAKKEILKTKEEPQADIAKPKRGRPKKGEVRLPKEPTRLEQQSLGQTIKEMIDDLPADCNVGTKRNSKGYKVSWTGYKLHIDAIDGGIPVSCLLTSASMHDSQAAIPLAEITNKKINSCYDLMDAAYDSPLIKAHSASLGHIPIIDENPRRGERKADIVNEHKAQRTIGFKYAEDIRYNERSTVERVNGRIKDDFGARMIRVQGHAKVMTHLMFGIVALTVDQLMRLID